MVARAQAAGSATSSSSKSTGDGQTIERSSQVDSVLWCTQPIAENTTRLLQVAHMITVFDRAQLRSD